MALIKWDSSFSVNVEEIDEQHKMLVGMINTFYESIKGEQRDALGALLDSLIDYTHYHFSTEENYMDRFNYQNTESHKQEHRLFTEKVLDVKRRFDEEQFVITFEITNYLRDWIVNHVMKSDKRYSRCFNDNGLE